VRKLTAAIASALVVPLFGQNQLQQHMREEPDGR
jgi:hypothetical protein